MDDDLKEKWLTLSRIPGLGPALLARLLAEIGTPENIFQASAARLSQVSGIGKKLVRTFNDQTFLENLRASVRQELATLSRRNFLFHCPGSSSYPRLLENIYDPPACLYSSGPLESLKKPAIAVVGSRAATSYGKQISYTLSRDLGKMGFTVVSGLALGIDSEAHRGAIAGGGETVGVLGCGLDVFYPKQNEKLYTQVAQNGAVISEYPLQTKPDAFRFPARNRIISGISLGVIVIEATVKSGSLITARLALDQGREVFAVPGRIDSAKSGGTHRLLQQGAHLVHCAKDIVDELALVCQSHDFSPELRRQALSSDEQKVLPFLEVYPLNIDKLADASGKEPAQLHSLLLSLELKGYVRQVPGQQYELIEE